MDSVVFDAKWYLIFQGKGYRSKWLPWLKPGFTHVLAVQEDEIGWIVVNPCREYTEITYKLKFDYPSIYCFVDPGDTISSVQVRTARGVTRGRFTFMSCVEIIKSLLGMSAPTVWTPYQLYRRVQYEQRQKLCEASSKKTATSAGDSATTGTGEDS